MTSDRFSADYVVGADMGQAQDPTAVAVVERTRTGAGQSAYHCRHLERYPLGTPYVTGRDEPPEARGVGERLRALLRRPPLPGSPLVVDETGVGRAVVDSLRLLNLGCPIWPATITAGAGHSLDPDGTLKVSKRELVGTLQVLLGTGRLLIAAGMPLAGVLLRELQDFRVKVTASANETFSAREGQHDDLVLAVALAVWLGERCPAFTARSFGHGGRPRAATPRGGESLNGDFRRIPKGV